MIKNKTFLSDWDRMVAGKLYNPSGDGIAKPHARGLRGCDRFNRIPVRFAGARRRALNRLIPSAKGKSLDVFGNFYCEYGVNIHVGNGCFLNYNCTFLDVEPITLGDGVWFGANVTLATPMHPFLAEERLCRNYPDGFHDLEYALPITIDRGCWICSGATVCGGVHIGENSIVAAGAVVTRDVPPNSIVAGVPARVLRQLDEGDRMDVWQTYLKNESPLRAAEKQK